MEVAVDEKELRRELTGVGRDMLIERLVSLQRQYLAQSRETTRLKGILETLGVCDACDGTGTAFEDVPHGCSAASMPVACDQCHGRGCEAAQRAVEWEHGYLRSILDLPANLPVWEALTLLRSERDALLRKKGA